MDAIVKTDFNFPGQVGKYVGKVRDVYDIDGKYLVMVVSDRISAFDVVLPKGIPFKGQILNQIAAKFLDATSDILPNWKIATPDPMVTVGYKCEPYRVEMVIRGCLAGHAWREYQEGKRTLCGVALPDGMVEGQAFPEPIITPSAKAMTRISPEKKSLPRALFLRRNIFRLRIIRVPFSSAARRLRPRWDSFSWIRNMNLENVTARFI